MDKVIIKELIDKLSNEEHLSASDMDIILQFMDFFIKRFKTNWGYQLTDIERRRLMGSGIRRYGFIDKTSDVASVNTEYAPMHFSAEELKKCIREIEFFRNFLQKIRTLERIFSNALLVRSDEAYRLSLLFYKYISALTRIGDEAAITMFNMIKPFFSRPHRATKEPSEHKLVRNLKSLLHGKKDGEIIVKNEKPHIEGGKHIVIDETYKAKDRWKAIEEGGISN